jgi:hypothetical protein
VFLLDRALDVAWEKETSDFVMGVDVLRDEGTIGIALFGGGVLLLDMEGNVLWEGSLPEDVRATVTGVALAQGGRSLLLSTWEGDVLECELVGRGE